MSRSNLIVVTGFGPFKGYEQKNPSWEAVKLLPDTVKLEEIEYNIQKFNVPVEFTEVDKIVNDIWPLEPLVGNQNDSEDNNNSFCLTFSW